VCLAKEDSKYDIKIPPENGCYVYGLYLEGANWNEEDLKLEEQKPKVLFSNMSNIYFLPMTDKEL